MKCSTVSVCITFGVLTICLYDYNILSLIEVVRFAVLFKNINHLVDTAQGSVEVGARLSVVTCRCRMYVLDMAKPLFT